MTLNILSKFFGNKSSKDRKEYQPLIDKSNELSSVIQSLSDDELRAKTLEFKTLIAKKAAPLESELNDLKAKAADPKTPIQDKENIFESIDKMTKTIDESIEVVLKEIEAEAFAVVKETAKRWATNKQLVVTAQDFDKELSLKKDGIEITGDIATWKNQWTAARCRC